MADRPNIIFLLPDQLRAGRRMRTFGIDVDRAGELTRSLEAEHGVRVPVTLLLDDVTIGQVAQTVGA